MAAIVVVWVGVHVGDVSTNRNTLHVEKFLRVLCCGVGVGVSEWKCVWEWESGSPHTQSIHIKDSTIPRHSTCCNTAKAS